MKDATERNRSRSFILFGDFSGIISGSDVPRPKAE